MNRIIDFSNSDVSPMQLLPKSYLTPTLGIFKNDLKNDLKKKVMSNSDVSLT